MDEKKIRLSLNFHYFDCLKTFDFWINHRLNEAIWFEDQKKSEKGTVEST